MDYVARVRYGEARADNLFRIIATARNIGAVVILGTISVSDVLNFKYNSCNNLCT